MKHQSDEPYYEAVNEDDLRILLNELYRTDRLQAVICLGPMSKDDAPSFEPSDVRSVVGPNVEIWYIRRELLWALRNSLPSGLEVPPDGIRIFWPGTRRDSRWTEHPRVMVGPQALDRLSEAWSSNLHPVSRPAGSRQRSRVSGIEGPSATIARLRKQVASLTADLRRARRLAQAAERERGADLALARPIGESAYPEDLDREGGFQVLITEEWVRALNPTERRQMPLPTIVLGRDFIRDLGGLARPSHRRVAWVCAMVACGRAVNLNLEVHPIRVGRVADAKQLVRADGATAWRCALEQRTPSAARLHWWARPSGYVEFANAVRHDEFGITH